MQLSEIESILLFVAPVSKDARQSTINCDSTQTSRSLMVRELVNQTMNGSWDTSPFLGMLPPMPPQFGEMQMGLFMLTYLCFHVCV